MGCPLTEIRSFHLRTETCPVSKVMCSFQIMKVHKLSNQPGSGHVGFRGGQSGAGAGFLRVLRFPLPIFIPPTAPKIILIYHRDLYSRPKWPQYQGLKIPRDDVPPNQ
jgi:hypothetical protein